jgi:hypothetical protein
VKTFLTNSLAQSKNFDGVESKLTYATGRDPHEDFSEDDVNSRYPNICQDPHDYKKMEKQEDLQWSPPTRRREGTDHWLLEDTPLVVRRHLKQSNPRTRRPGRMVSIRTNLCLGS